MYGGNSSNSSNSSNKDYNNKNNKKGNKGYGKKDGKQEYLPAPIPTVVPRFDVDDPAGIQYLEENGYVVFKDVATPEELEKGKGLAWDFIENVTPGVKRNDPKTWDTPAWPNPFGNGIVCGNGVGHCDFLWYVRGIDKVSRIYKKIWKVEDVITSFDGFCIHRAWEYNSNWKTKEGNWFHLDQNGHQKPDRICVQGFLNFFPSGLNDGGVVVVPKSHTVFNQIFTNRPKWADRNDFITVFNDRSVWDNEIKAAKLYPIKVCAEAGDFILWDSRVIHCNAPATEPRKLPEGKELLPPRRLVAYVCMTPKARLNHSQLSARVTAFKEGLTTSHWPEDCVTQSARKNNRSDYVPPTLTPLQKSLVPLN